MSALAVSTVEDRVFVGRRILALLNDPRSNAVRLGRLLDAVGPLADAVIETAEVLYEGRGRVTSTAHAVTLIGFSRLERLTRGFPRPGPGAPLRRDVSGDGAGAPLTRGRRRGRGRGRGRPRLAALARRSAALIVFDDDDDDDHDHDARGAGAHARHTGGGRLRTSDRPAPRGRAPELAA